MSELKPIYPIEQIVESIPFYREEAEKFGRVDTPYGTGYSSPWAHLMEAARMLEQLLAERAQITPQAGEAEPARQESDSSMIKTPVSRMEKPPSPVAPVWQPIETAPMTGQPILLAKIAPTKAAPEFKICARPPHVWWVCKGSWSHQYARWWDGIEPSGLAGPTHWYPMLKLPPDSPGTTGGS